MPPLNERRKWRDRRLLADRRTAEARRGPGRRSLRERRAAQAAAEEKKHNLERLNPMSRHQRLALVMLTYVVTLALCGWLDTSGFDYFEQYAQLVRQGVFVQCNGSLAKRAQEQVALILIRDETFKTLPGPPLPRNLYARLIRDLTKAGARVIAFDLVFDLPSAHDAELAAAARASGKVVWASLFEEGDPQRPVLPVAPLLKASRTLGHIQVRMDSDLMVVDSIEPIIVAKHNRIVPAFSVATAVQALGLQKEPFIPTRGGWQIGNLTLPTDKHDRFKITYLGSPLRLPGESAPHAFEPTYYENLYGDPHLRFFRNKVVIIGDVTTVGNDHRFTPVGDMDGIEMHAHAIADILQRTFVHEVPEWTNLVVLCLLAALISPFAAALPLPRASLAAVVLLFIYATVNIWLYVDHLILLHFVGPAVGLGLTAFAILIERGLIEEREKRRIQGLLRRYVSPQIASYVMANPKKCFLGGDRVTATVLFSDIRGFTALSEKLTPEQAVTRLNEYLQVMANVVFQNEGTVDKYIGDGIMALFGVPVPYEDHAGRAVRTALDMQTSLLKMQDQWRAQGLPVLEIGIGINTGEMIVGNIGASERQDFTVIGDAVNLASRVEGLTKELGKRILITEPTYQLIKNQAEVDGPFETQVKGKTDTVIVYEVCGWRGSEEAVA